MAAETVVFPPEWHQGRNKRREQSHLVEVSAVLSNKNPIRNLTQEPQKTGAGIIVFAVVTPPPPGSYQHEQVLNGVARSISTVDGIMLSSSVPCDESPVLVSRNVATLSRDNSAAGAYRMTVKYTCCEKMV